VSNDPLASKEWHKGAIDLTSLGDEFTGSGIAVGVFDDGIEKGHADLSANYDASKEFVYNGATYNPQGAAGQQNHGTAVAGIIAAVADNGAGGSGIAPKAKITAVDIIGNAGGAMIPAIGHMAAFDLTSNSWNWVSKYVDGVGTAFGAAFQNALKSAAETGRAGLGTVIVVAAGNDWQTDRRDANYSEFSASRHTITVGAWTDLGTRASYSNTGANILVAAPSNGGSKGIFTTDETGSAGYSSAAYTETFGGTSAATPIVSGVVALMLEASGKSLGWRDVQEILAFTADVKAGGFEETGGAYVTNQTDLWAINGARTVDGGGKAFSNDAGFGQVDAYEAVRFSEVWTLFGAAKTSANEASVRVSDGTTKAVGNGSGFTDYQLVVGTGLDLDYVTLTLTMTHGNVEDLRIELISPDGTRSLMLTTGSTTAVNAFSAKTWMFGSNEFRGELSAGTWTVRVTDTRANSYSGSVSSVVLDLYGDGVTVDNVYHYTDDFMKMLAIEPSRSLVTDTNGGTDWLNFSAIRGGIDADLSARTILMRGVSTLTIAAGTTIENVVAGDGADVLRGNDLANHLVGMRGDDLLDGRLGADLLDGGAGSDTASYALSLAAVDVDLTRAAQSGGDAEGDRLIAIENVVGSAFADTLTGDARANRITGGAGDDRIDGGAGTDTAVFSGLRADYAVTANADGSFTLADMRTSGDGTDRVVNVERFRFADGYVAAADLVTTLVGDGNLDEGGTGGAGGRDGDGGTAGADIINGTAADDVIDAGAGDDTIFMSTGKDVVDGGEGVDTFVFTGAFSAYALYRGTAGGSTYYRVVGTGVDTTLVNVEILRDAGGATFDLRLLRDATITGTAKNDTLKGSDQTAERLNGLSGDDILKGSAGADILDGGTGLDTADYSASTVGVTVDLAAGTLSGGQADGDILISIENVTGSATRANVLSGDGGANVLKGGAGDDRIAGRGGADTLDGGKGIDTVDYSESSAGVTVDLASTKPQSGGDAAGDKLTGFENVVGTDFADVLAGTVAANQLFGGKGDDILSGGAGADMLSGGDGIDVASYATSKAGVIVDLALAGTQAGGDAAGDLLSGIEGVVGSTKNDVLSGEGGANVLDGGAGNDILEGRGGADRLVGGAGLDTARYAASSAAVAIDLSAGSASGGDAAGDVLVGIENLVGSAFADILTGDAGANVLSGGGGDDVLADGLGNDSLFGEAGDDLLVWFGGVDRFDGGLGTDTLSLAGLAVGAAINLAGTVTAGKDKLTFVGIEKVVGSRFADVVTGSALADDVDAGGGDDVVTGGAGNDRLDGGAGTDVAVYAGRRADYTVTAADDGSLTVRDLRSVKSDGTDVLKNFESLRFSDGTLVLGAALSATGVEAGSSSAQTVFVQTGGAKADKLAGSAGADHLSGGAGNDNLSGSDGADLMDGGVGLDTADYGASLAGVTVDLATGSGSGGQAEGDILIGIEIVRGSAKDDALTGSAGADELWGMAGADVLVDGLGTDKVYGGDGDDRLVWIGGAGDLFDGGAGLDTLDLSRLAARATVDLATGKVASGTGSLVAKAMEAVIGTAFDDVIVGGRSGDRLAGGAGDDVLTGGAGADVFQFAAGSGHDRITDFRIGEDKIAIDGAAFADLSFTAVAGGVLVGFGDDDILVSGVATLARGDFLLYA